jgi:hypothetical protein
MALKPNRVTATAPRLLSTLKSKVGSQIVDSYHIEAMTFQRAVGFRNIRQGQIRLNTILFDLTAASSHGLSRSKLVESHMGYEWTNCLTMIRDC